MVCPRRKDLSDESGVGMRRPDPRADTDYTGLRRGPDHLKIKQLIKVWGRGDGTNNEDGAWHSYR